MGGVHEEPGVSCSGAGVRRYQCAQDSSGAEGVARHHQRLLHGCRLPAGCGCAAARHCEAELAGTFAWRQSAIDALLCITRGSWPVATPPQNTATAAELRPRHSFFCACAAEFGIALQFRRYHSLARSPEAGKQMVLQAMQVSMLLMRAANWVLI